LLYYAKVIQSDKLITVNRAAEIEGKEMENTMEEDNMDRWGIHIKMQGDIQSNGSFQEQAGALAWTIESATKQNCILRFGRMLGMEHGQSVYRSELFGI